MVAPSEALVGALVMAGHGAALPSAVRRYGGVKISPSAWLMAQPPHSPPPPVKTRPSGRRRAPLW